MTLIRPQSVDILIDCPDVPGEVVVIFDKGLPSEARFVFPPHVMAECGAAECVAAARAGCSMVGELREPKRGSIALMREHGPELDS